MKTAGRAHRACGLWMASNERDKTVTSRRNRAFGFGAMAAAVAIISVAAQPAAANPTFARMTGHTCAVCHVPAQEPLLNRVGQEFKSCGFSFCKGPPPAAPSVQPQPVPPRPPAPQPAFIGPSFDCGARLNAAEAVVCRDRELAGLDVRMDQSYRRALARAGGREAEGLRAGQRAFIQERNDCGGNRRCVYDAYTSRLDAIDR